MGNAIRPRVLVCDDEASFVRLLEINLQRVGFDVVTAYDGEDAFQKAESQPPALMLVDLMMPRVDGVELVKRMRANESLAQVPIFVLTADVMDEHHERASEAGADEILTKPLDLTALIQRLKPFLVVSSLNVD